LVGILAGVFLATGGDDDEFKTFTAADAGFKADFPGTPKRSDQEVPAGAVTLRLVQYTSDVADDIGYSVGWFELVTPPADEAATRTFLEATRTGSVSAIKGTLVSSTFITVEGKPAVEYLAKVGENQHVKSRTILSGNDVFVLQVVGNDPSPPRYQQFVDSFRVV
jgi:hypothetical protein